MPFKNISYLELCRPSFSVEQNRLDIFGKGHYEEHFCEIILNLDQWFRRRCRLKYFLSRVLAAERNHLVNYGRWPQEEHFVKLF